MNNNWKYLPLLAPMALVMPAYAADFLTEAEAQKILFPEANEFTKQAIALSDDQVSKIKSLSGVRQRTSNPLVWKANKKGKVIGTVVIDEVVGKHEYITYAVGVGTDGKVTGIEVLSYRETHGGEIRQESWRANFKGKKISDPFKLDEDVPNITGATLSCRNVLDGVKRVLTMLQVVENG